MTLPTTSGKKSSHILVFGNCSFVGSLKRPVASSTGRTHWRPSCLAGRDWRDRNDSLIGNVCWGLITLIKGDNATCVLSSMARHGRLHGELSSNHKQCFTLCITRSLLPSITQNLPAAQKVEECNCENAWSVVQYICLFTPSFGMLGWSTNIFPYGVITAITINKMFVAVTKGSHFNLVVTRGKLIINNHTSTISDYPQRSELQWQWQQEKNRNRNDGQARPEPDNHDTTFPFPF